MKVQSTLMAFAGSLVTEDDDYGSSVSNLDADGSHPFARFVWSGLVRSEWYEWEYTAQTPPPVMISTVTAG